jgi:hypothetical protein
MVAIMPHVYKLTLTSKENMDNGKANLEVRSATDLELLPYNSDQSFIKIMKELKVRKSNEGKPLGLTFATYLKVILSLTLGETREKACLVAGLSKSNFYRYLGGSDTFKQCVELAEDFQHILACSSVIKILVSTQDHSIKTIDRKGNSIVKFVEAKITDEKIRFIKWFMERRDYRYAKHKLCRRCNAELEPADFGN